MMSVHIQLCRALQLRQLVVRRVSLPCICHMQTMSSICEVLPVSQPALEAVEGLNAQQLQAYGHLIIQVRHTTSGNIISNVLLRWIASECHVHV